MRRRALRGALGGSVLLLLLLTLAPPAGAGQREFGVSWNIAMPLGDTADFTKNLSLRGITVDYHAFRSHTTSWGLNVGWTVFTENPDDTLVGDGYAITGQRWNYINAVPIYVSGFHYWGQKRQTSYFAGANLGAVWAEYRTTVGLYNFQDQAWHFAVAPEIGMRLPMSSFLGFISLRYHLLMKSGEIDTQSWLELRIGFGR